ncbi:hypothetical protein C1H46_001198 [Malus baccata]|uniref:Uncharacterized protein n=1 Tax=Malus baccata TaxID=106549 RepID=A0A540NQ00_MALBA|nr:hypothetical protein C1H46_001198 [Malus baccata]
MPDCRNERAFMTSKTTPTKPEHVDADQLTSTLILVNSEIGGDHPGARSALIKGSGITRFLLTASRKASTEELIAHRTCTGFICR